MTPEYWAAVTSRAAFATSERRASLPYSWYRSVLQRVEVAETSAGRLLACKWHGREIFTVAPRAAGVEESKAS